jgi:hypothetical protein
MVAKVLRLRDANRAEAPALEALQRRSSDVWEAYRQQLAANPDAITLPATFIDNGCVRLAVDGTDTPIGSSVAVPTHVLRRAAFHLIAAAQTRFGPAVHMRRELSRWLPSSSSRSSSDKISRFAASNATGPHDHVGSHRRSLSAARVRRRRSG